MLAQQISQIQGVAQVLIYGAQRFAIRVQVDPVAAAARNISLDEIRNAREPRPIPTCRSARSPAQQQNITLQASGALTKAADYQHDHRSPTATACR